MSACEKCWTEAQRRALTLGGTVATWYHQVLAENDDNPDHTEVVQRQVDDADDARVDQDWGSEG